MTQLVTSADRLIVALDVPTVEQARQKVEALGDAVSFYKIGYQLMPVGGFDLARELIAGGKKVFLDLKFLDIGNTVEKGAASVASIGANFLTVHADEDALKGAVAGRGYDSALKILAVTVLTSWNEDTLKQYKIPGSVEDLVLHRAEIAAQAGADGVVASALEAEKIRERFGSDLLIVTPGVRPTGSAVDDQKRVVTPASAIRAGSDYLVVGRPVLNTDDLSAAASQIQSEIFASL